MKKFAVTILILVLSPANLAFGPPALVESSRPAAPLYGDQVAMIESLQAPSLTAASAIVVDARSPVPLFQRNANALRPMASVTKIMTALLALEQGRLDQLVRVNVDAAELVDSSVMGLLRGEELTLEDLLYGLLLPSGNDAAIAIAEHIARNERDFVLLMNKRAADLDMVNSRFANSHGLDDPEHYSTASDLVLLGRAAMSNPIFAKIVSTTERRVVGKLQVYDLVNTNRLLSEYPLVDGVKTGSTDLAGQCLVSTAPRDGGRVFTVVLGSEGRFLDTKSLLDHYFGTFTCQTLALPQSPFHQLPPGAGQEDQNALDQSLVSVDPPVGDCRPNWQARWLRSEVTWDPSIGDSNHEAVKVTWYAGDQPIATRQVRRQ